MRFYVCVSFFIGDQKSIVNLQTNTTAFSKQVNENIIIRHEID